MRRIMMLASAAAAIAMATPALATVNVAVTTGNPLTTKIYDIKDSDVSLGYGSLANNTTSHDVILTPNTAVDIADGFSTIKEFVDKKGPDPINWTSLIVDPNVAYSAIQYSIQLEGDGNISMYYRLTGSNAFALWGAFQQDHDTHVQYLMNGATFDALMFTVTGTTFKEVKQISIDQTPSVPEPATWAMMLFGFAGIGVTMRRARKRNAVWAQLA